MFRINRDVRFSKSKRPYRNQHVSGHSPMSRTAAIVEVLFVFGVDRASVAWWHPRSN